MEPHATSSATEAGRALADAVTAALPGWVERSVARILAAWSGGAPDAAAMEAARESGRRAAAEVGAAVRTLLEADVDDQRTTPLALLRAAVGYPTDVLQDAGVPPVVRDPVQVRLLPHDLYDLSPASFADVDPALAEPGLVWGAAKALAHRRRHTP